GDGGSLSLWLDGQAEQGLPMAMAAAVALPEGVPPETVTVHRDRYRLALDVSIRVERGRTYDFTKFIAVSRAGWGGNATDDLALAREARDRGFDGAMYPWESDPENGSEQTPHSAYVLGETEIHVNADVAIAQWQYYLATHDRDWLRAHGWPVIREVARFWASRATYDPGAQRYGIAHVNSVAESNTDIPNDTFTN